MATKTFNNQIERRLESSSKSKFSILLSWDDIRQAFLVVLLISGTLASWYYDSNLFKETAIGVSVFFLAFVFSKIPKKRSSNISY